MGTERRGGIRLQKEAGNITTDMDLIPGEYRALKGRLTNQRESPFELSLFAEVIAHLMYISCLDGLKRDHGFGTKRNFSSPNI